MLPMAELLEAIRDHPINTYEVLVERGYHPNVVYAKFERAARKHYIDYGVNPRRGWLTDRGEAFIDK